MNKARYLALLLLLISYHKNSLAQAGDCPYPVLFLHGLDSDKDAFLGTYGDSDFIGIWGGMTDVFEAVVNATYSYTIEGSDAILGNNDDDVLYQFVNESNTLAPGCIYVSNFDNFWDENTSSPNIDYGGGWGFFESESDSNEAAIKKQGYALKIMISRVLAANPGKNKVVLVGHSMGGLMSREYLQRTSGGTHQWWIDPSSSDGHKVKKLLTVGTPHLGSNSFGNLFRGEDEEDRVVPDLFSEAIRDLRYSFGCGFLNLSDCTGVYLYGGDENDLSGYWNHDVDLDGSESTSNVIGINQVGSPEDWDGTRDNTSMPLPTNVRYTYYVSNLIGGFFSTCTYPDYGCAGDGIVDDERQWIYSGGNGKTDNYVDGFSIPEPNDGVPHRLTDRITSTNRTAHTSQPGDIDFVIRGLDEGDYPKFAWKINMNTIYAGIAQMPPDLIPADGNRASGEDHDWYKVTIPSNMKGLKISVLPNPNLSGRIDFYDQPADYETANSTSFVTFPAGTTSAITLKAVGCFSIANEYYIRVTHDNVAIGDWKIPFTITVETLDVDIPTAVGTYLASHQTNDRDGWTHYWKEASATPVTTKDLLILSVKKDGTTNIFPNEVMVGVTNVGGHTDLSAAAYVTPGELWYVMNRYWDVTPTTQPGGGGVDVKFYYKNYDYNDLKNAVNAQGGAISTHEDMTAYKFSSGSGINPDPSLGHIGGTTANFIKPGHSHFLCVSEDYAEFHTSGFSGGGLGGIELMPLPVELSSFDVYTNDKQEAILIWETQSEINNDFFQIEKSQDGRNFEFVEKVKGTGTTSTLQTYQFIDKNLEKGLTYYRLKQVDFDGTFEYSNIKSVEWKSTKREIIIFPNPANNLLYVEGDFAKKTILLEIINTLGQQIYSATYHIQENQRISIPIQKLPSGHYFLNIMNNNGSLDGQSFTKK